MAETPAIDDTLDAVPGRKSGAARLVVYIAEPLLGLGALALLLLIALDSAYRPISVERILLCLLGVLGLLGAWLGLHMTRRRLRRLRELMQSICDEGRDAIFVKDRDSRYLFANITTASLFGRKAVDVIGLRDDELLGNDNAAAYLENDRVCLQRGIPTLFREKQDVPGQGERSFLVTKMPLHDAGGDVIGLLGIARDITEELDLRQLAERRTEEMRALFAGNPLPVLVFAIVDLRLLDANPAALRCYGYTREELLSMRLPDLCASADAARLRDNLRERARKQPAGSVPYRHKRKGGEEFDAQTDTGTLRHDGTPARLMIVRDLSTERRLQQDLHESERRYADLVESGLGVVWMHDLDGRLLRVNAAMAQALGYEREEMIGRNLSEFVAEESQAAFEEYLERTHNLRRDAGVIHLAARNGERRVWQYRSVYYPDAEPLPYVLGSAQDVTLRHQYESHLREQNVRDALTQCYNRRYLETFTARAARDQRWGCVIVDIDHFKQINDRDGHDRGDEVLREIAALLQRNSRTGDAVVRLGGDEFAVILAQASEQSAQEVTVRLRAASASATPVGFSLGWAVREGDEPLDSTLRRADKALLRARIEQRGLREDDRPPPRDRAH
ncbi:MAG: PAS domain S-box protein [Pseudomonadota bacterium]|nr:PAS domain S-box protein [Pseudomonadota bacterium]